MKKRSTNTMIDLNTDQKNFVDAAYKHYNKVFLICVQINHSVCTPFFIVYIINNIRI